MISSPPARPRRVLKAIRRSASNWANLQFSNSATHHADAVLRRCYVTRSSIKSAHNMSLPSQMLSRCTQFLSGTVLHNSNDNIADWGDIGFDFRYASSNDKLMHSAVLIHPVRSPNQSLSAHTIQTVTITTLNSLRGPTKVPESIFTQIRVEAKQARFDFNVNQHIMSLH